MFGCSQKYLSAYGGPQRKKVNLERLAAAVNALMAWDPGTAEALSQRDLHWYSELCGIKDSESAGEKVNEFITRS